MIISCLVLLRMRNISDKFAEKVKTHFMFNNLFNSKLYEIKWKNIVETDRPRMTIWRMHITCTVTKATNAHSEYVILIAFSRQKLLQERDSVLRYTYIAFFVLKFLIDYRMSLSLLRCIIICYYIFKILLFVFVL